MLSSTVAELKSEHEPDLASGPTDIDENDAWESSLELESKPYVSSLFGELDNEALTAFLADLDTPLDESAELVDDLEEDENWYEPGRRVRVNRRKAPDPLWEQVKYEATQALAPEPQAGPQLYQGILSQPSLIDALVTVISLEIETELMPAIALRNLFLDMLTPEDDRMIHLDVMAAAMRSSSVGSALTAILFNKGLHALVCYRVGHRLWRAGRKGLAYYMQSTVSSEYSADIHPAARIGAGIYLNCGGGVVIGETAVVGEDVSILQGVTLGGTGKEAGDRHPKVGNGVILHDSATVLGNIKVGDGAVVTAKSIVTKEVPPLARVSGVPAKVKSYRELTDGGFSGGGQEDGSAELENHLRFKYMERWQKMNEYD